MLPTIYRSLSQSLKAVSSISTDLFSNITSSKLLQYANVYFFIFSTFGGIFICFRFSQPLNANSPISSTLGGKITSCNPLHSSKANLPINFNDSGKLIFSGVESKLKYATLLHPAIGNYSFLDGLYLY